MNAQEKLIEYANELKSKSNTLASSTPQEIMGQAFVDGVCWLREPNALHICNVTRSGKEITVTETVIKEVNDVIDGKLVAREEKTTEVIFTVSL